MNSVVRMRAVLRTSGQSVAQLSAKKPKKETKFTALAAAEQAFSSGGSQQPLAHFLLINLSLFSTSGPPQVPGSNPGSSALLSAGKIVPRLKKEMVRSDRGGEQSFWVSATGPETEFRGNGASQELNQLQFTFGAVQGSGRKAVDLRKECAQARPELITGCNGLEVFRIHWFVRSDEGP
jgi:hypothetical protein